MVMGRMANDMIYKMSILTKRLEVRLGPDTGECQRQCIEMVDSENALTVCHTLTMQEI